MRLDNSEKEALKFALKGFKGDVYLFGSRLNPSKKGGDIDLLLVPRGNGNAFTLSLDIQTRFFSKCEESIDVLVYEDSLFCREILKRAKKLDVSRV